MSIRISKIVIETNVALPRIVEFLHKKGFTDFPENNPNEKLTDEQEEMIYKEFAHDQSFKQESEKISQQRQNKEKKESVALEGYEEGTAKKEPEEIKINISDSKPQFKSLGKIDLDSLNKKSAPKYVEPVVAKVQESKVEEPIKENEVVKKTEVKSTLVASSEQPKTQEDEVFRLGERKTNINIKTLGSIDLKNMDFSTRPAKKSKEEKKKEREEREKQRQEQKKQYANKIQSEKESFDNKGKSNGNNYPNQLDGASYDEGGYGKKQGKRQRISYKERVDVENQGDSKKQHGGKHGKDFKKFQKTEISEEEVQRQIKETLARVDANKGKSKASKYKREKKEAITARRHEQEEQELAESKVIKLTEFVTANDLAQMMDISVNQIIGTCMSLGMMVSINQRLDAEVINLLCEEFGFKTEYVSAEVASAIAEDEEEDSEENMLPRPPIVTVMGHVDHGKTSLLDNIRNTNVIAGEAGGITQHIGAYHVKLENGKYITFLDTPGHEAFTAMRARGAKVTDIAIIIVSADDRVMPQTREAINHAVAAGVPIVFAINKIDKPNANPDKIKEELAAMNYLVEEWGGKYQSQDISAKKGIGVKELLEKVLLEAELLDLKANPNKKAVGSVIESSLDKGRGYVSTVLVESGTLHTGDVVLAGTHYGRVKAMFNERGQRVKEAGPSEPVLILGLNGASQAGDKFNVLNTDQEAREIATKREQLQREQGIRTSKRVNLEELGRRIALGNFQELNVIIKGDVDGSVEALRDSLEKLSTEEIQVNVIHKGVGQISETDVTLASASDAIIVGFQVRPSQAARRLAESEGVDIRLYSIIYDAIEEVKDAMEGMLSPEIKEEVTGTVEIREVFKITKVGNIAGCLVKEGKVKRTSKIRLIRDGIVTYTGELGSLKRFKDDAKEVTAGLECGLNIAGYNDIRVGDIIEAYEEIEIKKTL